MPPSRKRLAIGSGLILGVLACGSLGWSLITDIPAIRFLVWLFYLLIE